ncbi:hypothetical protein ACWEWG_34250 [Streptomyces sp. NPDC003758]
MSHTLPALVTEAAALSVAGAGLRRYEMGTAVIGAGADATVVIIESGDNPRVSGVQNSNKVLLCGDPIPDLRSRFDFESPLLIHVFVRLDRGCLSLGIARCRGSALPRAGFNQCELELARPLSRAVLDAVRPVPAPGPVPDVDWVNDVATDPIPAMESFILGWFPAEESESAGDESTAGGLDGLPEALATFYRLARLRPAILRFPDPVLKPPRRASCSLGDRLVFAEWCGAAKDWSIPWPLDNQAGTDPTVWFTEDPYDPWFTDDPYDPNAEATPEEEPLSRFLLQFTLNGAMSSAPYGARTYAMPTERFAPLWNILRPVPLSPFAYTHERFFVAPGLLARVQGDEEKTITGFAALHRGTLTPLLEHGFRWSTFHG